MNQKHKKEKENKLNEYNVGSSFLNHSLTPSSSISKHDSLDFDESFKRNIKSEKFGQNEITFYYSNNVHESW